MANVNAPYGLRPQKSASGETRINNYPLSSASARVYEGDLLTLSSGLVIKATTTSGVSLIGVAAANSGAIVAGGVAAFGVYYDPSTIFSVQAASAVAQSQVGVNYAFVSASATAGTNLLSIEALDISVQTAACPLFLLGLVNAPDNATGNFSRCLVKIATHYLDAQ